MARPSPASFLVNPPDPSRPAGVPVAVRDALREQAIGIEIQSTGSAVRTYNVLMDEGRAVAAALIAVDKAR